MNADEAKLLAALRLRAKLKANSPVKHNRKVRSDKGGKHLHSAEFDFKRKLIEAERVKIIEATGGRVLDQSWWYNRKLTRKRRGEARSLKERRAEHRAKLLPKDRRCPKCKVVKVKSKRWVVVNGNAVCLSCYRAGMNNGES